VLTLERLAGRRISEFITDGDTATRKRLACSLFDLYMKQFFEIGHFHADPHPGNILVDEALRINIIDFGLTGRLSDDLQGHLGTAILALRGNDIDLLTAVLEHLGIITEQTDLVDVRSDIANIIDTYMGMPIGRIDVAQTFSQMTAIAQRNALLLPRDFVLMGKAFVTVGGLARALDPEFNAAAALGPYMRLVAKKTFSPSSLGRSAALMAFHGAHFIKDAPSDLRRILNKALTGGLSLNFQHKGLERFINDLDRSSNRLAFSIIVASLIVASSMILNTGKGPLVYGMPVLGIVGYLLAALLGLWLIWAILRSGRL
jgi:ubiquinone biosynthesis protein